MTWAEFCIRSHAYRREDKKKWLHTREVAYYSLIGPHADPKKLPKTKELFIPLEFKSKRDLRKKQRERMILALKKYNLEKRQKNG